GGCFPNKPFGLRFLEPAMIDEDREVAATRLKRRQEPFAQRGLLAVEPLDKAAKPGDREDVAHLAGEQHAADMGVAARLRLKAAAGRSEARVGLGQPVEAQEQ